MTNKSYEISFGKLIFTFLYILTFPALLLFLSGDWLWLEGWIFSLFYTALCLSIILYLYRKDPALLSERYKRPGTANQKGWDIYVVFGLLAGFITWIVIMPLDAKRFGWTDYFPIGLKVLGGLALLLSFYFFYRSYADNTFVSPLIRIQKERKQRVVCTGVYSFVRHPMYLGGILLFIGTPMLLGSLYGIITGLVMLLLLVGRILGEEKMLADELEGYLEYKKKVKYRLIPFVW